jgi:antitoxin HicB
MSSRRITDHSGSSFDDFLEEEGLLEQSEAVAIKRVLAWQLQRAMNQKQVSKKHMAERLRTSRTQVDRLLNPLYVGVSLEAVARAARVVGKRIRVEIVDADRPRNGAKGLTRTAARPSSPDPHTRKRMRIVTA